MFTESLFAAALTFSSWHGDTETEEARALRLRTIAEAINIATLHAVCMKEAPPIPQLPGEGDAEQRPCTPIWRDSPRELAFLLLTQAYFETHLAQHVHEGKCRVHLGECDGGKATSLWQLQAGGHLAVSRWEKLAGTGLAATTHAAYEASRALARGRNYCGSLRGAIGLYATGRTCRWKPAEKRVAFMKRLETRHYSTSQK
jgi:hypothetical protein